MTLAALFNGSSGLLANSAALDVVGNNLANLNTTGYKTQRVLFKDQLYQTLSNGSVGSTSNGGTNPIQQGFGVGVSGIESNFLQGAINPTSRPLDAAIQGKGFFVLRNSTGQVYSRSGAFDIDANGFMVDPTTGFFVQRAGTVGDAGGVTPGFQVPGNNNIKIPFGVGVPGVATANVNFQGNLSTTLPVGGTFQAGIQVFDTQSQSRVLTVTFTKTAQNTFSASATIVGGVATVTAAPIVFDTNGLLQSPASLVVAITGIPGAGAQNINFNLGTIGTATGLSQFGGFSTAQAVTQDGTGAGTLTSVSIDNEGKVQGQFTNGSVLAVAQLAVAAFNNEGGLVRVGNNYYTEGAASGQPLIGLASNGGRGSIQGAALEGSNVDISSEFTKLIVAQRGFQINARVITAGNETLQELANIIR